MEHICRMKVSVCITTYNHEKYIAQAIESVLGQKTNFDIELLIGEDDSSDDTRRIVKEYKNKYPDRIRLFLNDRDNVVYIDGMPSGRWNFVNLIKNASGDFIAILDGDDYWSSPHKLQKQIDFFKKHPSCVVCGHNVLELFNNDIQSAHLLYPSGRPEIASCADLLCSNFLPTCSVVFRNHLIGMFPDWYFRVRMGDWPLYILLAQYGDVGYIDEPLGVYRRHHSSVWGPLALKEQYESIVRAYYELSKHFESNVVYTCIIENKISRYYLLISKIHKNNNNIIGFILYFIRHRMLRNKHYYDYNVAT